MALICLSLLFCFNWYFCAVCFFKFIFYIILGYKWLSVALCVLVQVIVQYMGNGYNTWEMVKWIDIH